MAVIGAGLAGSLLALALARRGGSVVIVAPEGQAATALSYGALPGRRPAVHWREWQRHHGVLGWRPSRLVCHGWPQPLGAAPPRLQALPTALMPFSRVDPVLLAQALPRCLAALAVRRVSATVTALEPLAAGGWRLNTDHAPVVAERVVLAAGASCRDLWPELPLQWRFSWAGVLALADWQGAATSAWLDQGRRGRIVLPRRLRRPAFEASSAHLRAPEWIVDPGLAPWGSGGLLGQITLAGPGLDPARPPDPMEMEERLRQGLGTLDPQLAEQPGQYRQVAVPFCLDGRPITASLAPDLWAFTGFSGAFATVPPLAEQLAAVLLNS